MKTYEYLYSIEDYNGDTFDEALTFNYHSEYDIEEQWERESLVSLIAQAYYSVSGFEYRSWVTGSVPVKIWIWLDKDTKFEHNVWCEFVPTFYVR